ncbi:MAG: TolC family protein [Lachnospiraceae bacterium]|nr:TolC family protein [Lachnospiraceae bacterium]
MKILARNREEKSSKMPGKILALILSATMFITPRFSVFAAPTGPGASPETERYDAATLARLQDNRIEYDEIPDLVHEYNPDISKAWNTYKNSREDFAKVVTEMESQQQVVKDLADQYVSLGQLTGSQLLVSTGRQLDKGYKGMIQGMRDTYNKWETNRQNTSAIRRAERQVIAGTQSAMIGYETMRQNIATLQTMVQLYEKQADMMGRMMSLGMATGTDLASANSSLLAARSQLMSLENQQESVRRTFCMLLGYDPETQPEICPIPEFDMSRLEGMNLEEDTRKAIGNNYTLISQRTSAKGNTNDQVAARSRMIEEGDQKLIIEMQRLYQEVQDKQAAYQAAQTGFAAAELNQEASERQYQLGLLSEAQYIGAQLAYYQKKAAKESANLNLLQAMENYDWGVLGFAVVSD